MGEVSGGERFHASAGKMRQAGGNVDERTLYEIGSVTKLFTFILLADTVLQGKAQLEDPVGRFVPESILHQDSPFRSVTLRQLATHASGLPMFPSNLDEDCEECSFEEQISNYSRKKMFTYLNSLTQEDLEEGKPTAYSNIGYDVLGEILSMINGADYANLLEARILSPLGMNSTWANVEGSSVGEAERIRMADGHRAGELAPLLKWRGLAGSGSIVSSVEDMLTFAEAFWSASTPDYLKKAFELVMKEHEGSPFLARTINNGDFVCYGMTGGFFARFQVNQDDEFARVQLTNSAEERIEVVREGDFTPIEGLWSGTVEFNGRLYPLAMNVTSEGSANVFVIPQGGTLLPSSRVSFDQSTGQFAAAYPGLKARYEAKLESDGKLRGIWEFAGQHPLEMERSENFPDVLRPVFEKIYTSDISSLVGYWSGTVGGENGSFKCLEVRPLEDRFHMRIWGAFDNSLPAGPAKVQFDAEKGHGELRVEVIHSDAVFEGSLDAGKQTINGVWIQGESSPLKLTWSKERPEGI